MKNFAIIYGIGDIVATYYVRAMNRGVARAKLKAEHPTSRVLTIRENLTEEKKALKEAAAQGVVAVGVQKSLNLGFSDLPLFSEDNQLKLF
ncbi:hypothetical protein [Runella salmonicolor]|uniref:Uncharacterized protein n=1 Tax=Runella salmonicolor TaxID=2950278 RepID=A0ABT1FRQ7_9BACT|nr:hypothetical protein [Runella salmonicolor]MCP1384447.1 hypothetical protein [Runella salmonicolor]